MPTGCEAIVQRVGVEVGGVWGGSHLGIKQMARQAAQLAADTIKKKIGLLKKLRLLSFGHSLRVKRVRAMRATCPRANTRKASCSAMLGFAGFSFPSAASLWLFLYEDGWLTCPA